MRKVASMRVFMGFVGRKLVFWSKGVFISRKYFVILQCVSRT